MRAPSFMDSQVDSVTSLFDDVSVNALESEDQLIIGLDFGTTFSGIAYAFSHEDHPNLISITDWPGLEGHIQPKVDTLISYDPEDKTKFTWGAQKHKSPPIVGIKLLLDPEQERPLYVPATNSKSELKKVGKSAMEVAADYIGAIYKHALSRIEAKITKDYLDMCQKKFVVTVPAVWSEKAQDLTLRAAKLAGIHPVSLITEPEAAALYTLHVLADRGLSVGDAFVICDAGGGTVDLISYEITELRPRLKLKMLVPSKGGMAGSLVLNKRFEAAVQDLLGDDEYIALKKKSGWTKAMQEFDRFVKTAFRGDEDEDYLINFPMARLPDVPENGLEADCWNMKGREVKVLFAPLITEISKLVEEQVNLIQVKRLADSEEERNKKIKAIFLVGGFGSSEYLKQCLVARHPNIQIIQPVDAWSAIVKGAVLSQLPGQALVQSTIARRHFGVSAWHVSEDGEDEGERKVRSPVTGKFRVMRMTWYIYQGEDLQRDEKIRFPFFRTLPENFGPEKLIFQDDLVSCDALRPAPYPKDGITRTFCTLTADLRGMSKDDMKKKTGVDGKTWYEVEYELTLKNLAAGFQFALEIDGAIKGSVEADYE